MRYVAVHLKPVIEQRIDMAAPNTKRPKQPLEAFPLDALKFVGILKEGNIVWALIKEPNGVVTEQKLVIIWEKIMDKLFIFKNNQ